MAPVDVVVHSSGGSTPTGSWTKTTTNRKNGRIRKPHRAVESPSSFTSTLLASGNHCTPVVSIQRSHPMTVSRSRRRRSGPLPSPARGSTAIALSCCCFLLWTNVVVVVESGGGPMWFARGFAWIPTATSRERTQTSETSEDEACQVTAEFFSHNSWRPTRGPASRRRRRGDSSWQHYFQQNCDSHDDDGCFVLDETKGFQPVSSSAPTLGACVDRRKRAEMSPPATPAGPDTAAAASWPPWLPSQPPIHERQEHVCDEDGERHDADAHDNIETEFQWIRYELLKRDKVGFRDVRDVSAALNRVRDAHRNYPQLVLGLVDFLRLLLVGGVDNDETSNTLVTKDVIMASILHYLECVEARQVGLEDQIYNALFETSGKSAPRACLEEERALRRLPPRKGESATSNEASAQPYTTTKLDIPLRRRNRKELVAVPDEYDRARLIARGASRSKRAEILAHVVLRRPSGASPPRQQEDEAKTCSALSAPLTRDEAERMRGLLLSVMDDWRSLAIRCTACLYRLEGIRNALGEDDDVEASDRTPLMVQTAREAMYVYAPLSGQLGMHRLKSAIEQRAFSILYRRQHRAVSSLFREKGEAMQMLNRYLRSSIASLLHEDEALMSQLEDLHITSRVKEPYSFWRKLLKARKKKLDRLRGSSASKSSLLPTDRAAASIVPNRRPTPTRFLRPSMPSSYLKIANVQDGIALRVVLKARRWSETESEEAVQERERFLCYYVQHSIRQRWPEVNPSRVKDYILNPKANGYQSLHHTSSVSFNGVDYFPFEVQIRSEDMHRVAEFGVAAHWDYKLLGHTPSNESSTLLVPEFAPGRDASQLSVDFSTATSVERPITGTSQFMPDEGLSALVASSEGTYLDALVTAQDKVLKENVYVFLVDESAADPSSDRRGTIVSLPSRSTVGDALLTLNVTSAREGGIDRTSYAIWKNGILADAYDKVENGDVLVIDLARATSNVLYPETCG